MADLRDAYPAEWHAEEAERLLKEAMRSIYNGPIGLDRNGCLAAAQVHATLAVFHSQQRSEVTE